MYKKAIPLARLVGIHSIRIHALRWDRLKTEPENINWSTVDDFMRLARENGFPDDRITFHIFVPEYAAVMPKNLDDWRKFIRRVMRRSPEVKCYELWNEPHLIGFSCFWADSTEHFVELLR